MTYNQPANESNKRLLGYIRKSIIDDDRTASPARQRAAIERVAAAQECALEWFEDLDISGRYEARRPGWLALLRRLESPDVAGVVVESYDRSHRNVREFLTFYDDVLEPRGQTLISANQQLNLATADGRAMASVLMTFAELESRKTSERMAATVRYKVEIEGRHWGGVIPYGCDRHPETKHLIPSERCYFFNPSTGQACAALRPGSGQALRHALTGSQDAAPPEGKPPPGWEIRRYYDALKFIFEQYASGRFSVRVLADLVNRAGWRYWGKKRDDPRPFEKGTIRSIVRRYELYAGKLPPSVTSPNKHYRHRPTLEGGHDPILPPELCEAAGVAYKRRSIVRGPDHSNKSEYPYLLSSVLRCFVCGAKMGGQRCRSCRQEWTYRHQYARYGCRERWISAPALEGQVIGALMELISGPLLDEIRAEVRAVLHQAAQELANSGKGELADLERKRAEKGRLIDLRVSGLISKSEFEQRRRPLLAEIRQLEQALNGTQLATVASVEPALDQIMANLGRLPQADPELKRDIVRFTFQRIEAGGGEVRRIVPQAWAVPFFEVCRNGAKLYPGSNRTELIILDWYDPTPILRVTQFADDPAMIAGVK